MPEDSDGRSVPVPVQPPDVGAVDHDDGSRRMPVLGETADLADAADRLMARMVGLPARVDDDTDGLDGLSVQVWLEQVCRITGTETRRLLGIVDTLGRLPSVTTGLADGRLSGSQTARSPLPPDV